MEEARYRGPAYETARLKLARIRVEGRESRQRGARYLTQVSADALGFSRVAVWLFRDGRRLLVTDCAYRSDARVFEAERTLELGKSGDLLAMLERRRVLCLDRPEDFATMPSVSAYLAEADSSAVLWAPIIREGRVVGALSFETSERGRLFDEQELGFVSSVADLAALVFEQGERVELEAALQASSEARAEAQKMQALVRLSRVIAHDLNGLLTVVSSASSELASGQSAALAGLAEDLEQVVLLGKKLTEQLLTFSGESPSKGEPVDLVGLVEGMMPVLRPLFRGETSLLFQSQSSTRMVVADPLVLQQVTLNLVSNARDAVGEKGQVIIRVRDAGADDALRVGALVLEVEDDGVGMDEHTQARAVEPYFTTKKNGHGLGLSTVFGVAQQFGGGVRIVSAPGQGTKVAVALMRV